LKSYLEKYTKIIHVSKDNIINKNKMLNIYNVKTSFNISYCHNTNKYNFTILNQSNNEILFNSQYNNIIEVNKVIQQYK